MLTGFFVTKIFHPNVSKGGEICVNVLKKDWTADTGLRHLVSAHSSPKIQHRRVCA